MPIRIIDLFSGIGGIRLGLEQAIAERGEQSICVFTSEIKDAAIKVFRQNHPNEELYGDITKIKAENIPDFDILCAGFPCQAFSSAGKRLGFADTRGTLFFDVERILKEKKPAGFILENVEGLVNHDEGKTLKVILRSLKKLKYNVSYQVLNSKEFGVPQERKRIYIVGVRGDNKVSLKDFPTVSKTLYDILECGQPTEDTVFVKNLLKNYSPDELYGKAIKDKRGGGSNIHSWDLEIKGPVTPKEKELLNNLLKERRKKKWADIIGIKWMDGMPLTEKQISTFYHDVDLKKMLKHLAKQGYLKYEYPKKLVVQMKEGKEVKYRVYDETKPKGYNIVAGKLSFEISKILDPNGIAPTLVAMDMQKLYVYDNGGLRKLTLREGLRLFGYPDDLIFNVSQSEGYDLLGNTVVVPVIKAVASRLLSTIYNN